MSGEKTHELHSKEGQPLPPKKQIYQPPTFSIYGKIDRLTSGGVGSLKEKKGGMRA